MIDLVKARALCAAVVSEPAAFIRGARTGWPEALDEIERLTKELEHFVAATDLGDIRSRCHKAEARVAVLREVVSDMLQFPYAGKRHPRKVDLDGLRSLLDDLGPAATALTERLKAAEAVVVAACYLTPYPCCCREACEPPNPLCDSCGLRHALAAWRKVKGNQG